MSENYYLVPVFNWRDFLSLDPSTREMLDFPYLHLAKVTSSGTILQGCLAPNRLEPVDTLAKQRVPSWARELIPHGIHSRLDMVKLCEKVATDKRYAIIDEYGLRAPNFLGLLSRDAVVGAEYLARVNEDRQRAGFFVSPYDFLDEEGCYLSYVRFS